MRDATTDPQAGDVFQKKSRRRTVLKRGGFGVGRSTDGVHFQVPSNPPQHVNWEALDRFLKWSKGAEIIERAD